METSKRQRGAQSAFNPFSSQRPALFPPHVRNQFPGQVGNPGETPPRSMGSWRNVGPDSPSKPASASAIAGRRILSRPIGGTSRPTSTIIKAASNVPASTPRRVFSSSTFRPGLTNGNHAKFAFSPRIPTNTMKESFPAATPGRKIRAPTADLNGRAMSKTSASNLFPMRIASPPPELDGEELAKQVPNDPNRVGSVYADEFLAHLVPSELDDIQQRQFLCILDLRRLKYAANEIFSKKDWRVNIMNFAKEYEKSRSLIMLRYGLYEFKTVPIKDEVVKKWKHEHGIPNEEEETQEAATPRPNGTLSKSVQGRASTKRRAEDELTKDFGSAATPSVQKKRRAMDREPLAETTAPPTNTATPASAKTKRGAEYMDEPDENQPNKFRKSQSLSMFEEVTNNSPAKATASPAKPATKSSWDSPAASKPASNPFAQVKSSSGPSIFSGVAAPNTGSTGNIFGNLAKEVIEESEDESDGGESEVQVSQSEAPSVAASGERTTPSLFGTTAPAPSRTPSEAGNAFSKGPSLFDRVQKGPDGQPIRATFPDSNNLNGQPTASQTTSGFQRPASPVKQAQPPQDKTWNPDTPIKFGSAAPQSKPLFGTTTTEANSMFAKQPAATSAINFGSTTPKPAAAPGINFGSTATPKTTAPGFSFGATATPKATEAPASTTSVLDFARDAPKPATSLFGQSAKSPEPAKSLFGTASKTPALGSQPFGSSVFGQQNNTSEQKPAASIPAPSTSLFGTQPKAAEPPAAQAQPKSLFAGLNTPATTAQPQTGSLFGNANAKPAGSLFGTTNGDGKKDAPAGFDPYSAKTDSGKTETPAPKRKALASDEAAAVFGSTSTEPTAKKILFGVGAPTSSNPPPKTAAAANGATDAASVFGATSKEGEKKFAFGKDTPAPAPTTVSTPAAAPSATPAPASLFGNLAPQTEQSKAPTNMFGASSGAPSTGGFSFGQNTSNSNNSAQPSTLFGNTAAAGDAGTSSSFTFGSDQSSFKNPFASGGDVPATPSFSFGATAPAPAPSQEGASPFQFGGNTTTTASAPSSFTFGAGSQPADNTPAPSGGSFTFGAGSQPTNNAPAPSGGSFTFGAGSQSTNTAPAQPFNMFGASNNNASAPANNNMFGGAANGAASPFNFGASTPSSVPNMFSQQPPANAAQGIFANNLGVPPMGSSTGTSEYISFF